MTCNDNTVNNRPLGAGYNSQGNPQSLVELTALSFSSATPYSGSSIIFYGAISAASYLGNGGGTVTTLDDLSDVTITSVANGNVLRFNGVAWVNSTALTTAESNIASHTISITNLTTSTVTNAVNIQTVSADLVTTLAELVSHEADVTMHFGITNGDLNIAGPAANQVLAFNGTKWVNSSLPSYSLASHTHSFSALSGASDVVINSPSQGQTIVWSSAGARWVNSSIPTGGGGGTTTPGGSNTYIQFNANSSFGGDSNLIYTSSTGLFQASCVSGVSFSGVSLSASCRDTAIVTPGSNNYLSWNNTTLKWVASAVPNTLSGSTDVTIVTPAGGNALCWSSAGSKWVASAIGSTAGKQFIVSPASLAAGDLFYYNGSVVTKIAAPAKGAVLVVNTSDTVTPFWLQLDSTTGTFNLQAVDGEMQWTGA